MCKSIRKRAICILLTFLLCFGFLPLQAFSAYAEDPANEEITLSETIDTEQEPSTEVLSLAVNQTQTPYYLSITHTLEINGAPYTSSEVVSLTESDFAAGSYNVKQHVIHKEGMTLSKITCADKATGLTEKESVFTSDFTQNGNPEDGSAYYGLQVVIEYHVQEGYRAVFPSDSNQNADQTNDSSGNLSDDPYSIMPLANFEGSNIKDITFVPADVVTIRLNYKYSPTGGLAGIDAAPTQVYQIHVPDVKRDNQGKAISAPELHETYAVPHYDANNPNSSALEGFRIVLNPSPLNAYVNDPDLAQQAMDGTLSDQQIQEALNSDAFAVSTTNAQMPVYEWQAQGEQAPGSYDDYTQNATYKNRFSDQYNKSWESARSSAGLTHDFNAYIESTPAVANQGANPLTNPMLTFFLTEEQCINALNSTDSEIAVTIYYRRNAGFYNVAHWVPHANIPADQLAEYQTKYPEYNKDDGAYHRDGLVMVYLEHKQGRVGALTIAQPYPKEAETILRPFVPQGFVQEVIETATTCVNITYDMADSYSLIFLTDGSYIPRQRVDAGDTVAFSATSDTSDTTHAAKMSITKPDGTVSAADDYENPTRQGYEFAGWKYEVKAIPTGESVTEVDGKIYRDGESGYYTRENNKCYKNILVQGDGAAGAGDTNANNAWSLSQEILANTVVVQDSNGDHSKIIYLSPIWTPNKANVRVVFWTEDLGGRSNDAKVTISNGLGNHPEDFSYSKNLPQEYLSGKPTEVGSSFSNVGSFTFMAPTGANLDLSVTDKALASRTGGMFTATGESSGTGDDADAAKTLPDLINAMFKKRMPGETVSYGDPINTALFYHAYQVDGNNQANYTVAADGSTVINVYFARNVYELNFTYYGTTTSGDGKGTGPHYSGEPGLVVATNTIGYTLGGGAQGYDYQYTGTTSRPNRWERVADGSQGAWTVPETITIQAKYNADLRETWPCTNNESIALTLQSDDTTGIANGNTTAYFVSWAATAGPFSEAYRDAVSKNQLAESTIMGSYCAMSGDIIADPEKPYIDATNQGTVHNLYAYWWNQELSYYRFNSCYEVPRLTWEELKKDPALKSINILSKEPALDFGIPGANPPYQLADNHLTDHIEANEAERRDTNYLVPINGATHQYFDDYRDDLLRYDKDGNEAEDGTYYAVRRISTADDSKIYAIARHAMGSSSNFIQAQAPSAEMHMTPMKISYATVWAGTWSNTEVSMDHSSRVWDDWGRTVVIDGEQKGLVKVGTPDDPYDLYYYYDRERFDIHYIVPAKDSVSGEYEYGTHQAIFGESLKKYQPELNASDKGTYSNDTKYQNLWTATDNKTLPGSLGINAIALNADGFAALVPDSAQGSHGTWNFKGWHLDRAGNVSAENTWNSRVSGNLRVFALWEPPQYKVKFDFQGGSYNGSSSFAIQNVPANVGYTSSNNPIPSPTRPGYNFAGWTWHESATPNSEPTAGHEIDFNFEKPITQDLVLTANWVSNAKQTYRYKIWYLTDDEQATHAEKPGSAKGAWLEESKWGTPHPDANHSAYTHVLGCQYFDNQELPANTMLSLVAESIPGYMPVSVNSTVTLKNEANTNATNTENVAYFYYRKSPVKTYKIRYQLYDKTGEDGIIDHLTTESAIADTTFFSPTNHDWLKLKASGYQLVQMDQSGNTVWNDGQPLPAQSYLDLDEFITARNADFTAMNLGEEALITFKVAPIPYSIDYQVGTLVGEDTLSDSERDAVKEAMQATLDNLAGDELNGGLRESVAAGNNPTHYKVTDFADNFSVILKNPKFVQNPTNPDEVWEFTGWSLGPGTSERATLRSLAANDLAANDQATPGNIDSKEISQEIYPELELEESVGDLVFLANWKKVGSDDPENPSPIIPTYNSSDDIASDGSVLAQTDDTNLNTIQALTILAGVAACIFTGTGIIRTRSRKQRLRSSTSL